MKTYVLAAALLAVSFTATAGNNNGPDYGDVTTNNNQAYNNPSATGGTAIANGGSAHAGASANAGAAAGAISGSNSSVGDVTNIAAGGAGGRGGEANQSQGQHQSNIGINGQSQSNTGVNKQGQEQSASSDQSQSQGIQSSIGATGSGNATNVGGQNTSVSFKTERNAPPVYLGGLTATMSCSGSFQAGSSSQGGSGAFGLSWISGDCRSVVAADKFRELGMVDTSCRILKTTKGFARAAKKDPSLKDISCEVSAK